MTRPVLAQDGFNDAMCLTAFGGPWAHQVVAEATSGSWWRHEPIGATEEYRRGFMLAVRTRLATWQRCRDGQHPERHSRVPSQCRHCQQEVGS